MSPRPAPPPTPPHRPALPAVVPRLAGASLARCVGAAHHHAVAADWAEARRQLDVCRAAAARGAWFGTSVHHSELRCEGWAVHKGHSPACGPAVRAPAVHLTCPAGPRPRPLPGGSGSLSSMPGSSTSFSSRCTSSASRNSPCIRVAESGAGRVKVYEWCAQRTPAAKLGSRSGHLHTRCASQASTTHAGLHRCAVATAGPTNAGGMPASPLGRSEGSCCASLALAAQAVVQSGRCAPVAACRTVQWGLVRMGTWACDSAASLAANLPAGWLG